MEKTKKLSIHRQLVTFFSDTALATRGFRPQIALKDAQNLKRALGLNIFGQSRFEQIMLYFLADKDYRNLTPSISTMLSAFVLNSLRNKAINRAQFFKEVDAYADRYLRAKLARQEPGLASMADMLAKLRVQLSYVPKGLDKASAPRAPVEKHVGGLFG